MRKLYLLVLSLVCINIYAVQVINIKTMCDNGTETALCKCGDGFIQTNLDEQCDLGNDKNGKDEDGDGKSDYGCTANCKVTKDDPNKTWECNTVTSTYSSSPILNPEKAEFNKLYLEMVTLYKTIKKFTINCAATGLSATDYTECTQQQIRVETFLTLNKHKPFLCDSLNDADKISANAYPNLKYIDMVSRTEKTVNINYETACGLGNLLLVPTKLKWNYNTNIDFETLYGCKMNFIKTLGGKFVRHANWIMYFLDDAGGTVSKLISDTDTQAKMAASPQAVMLNDLIYCVRKIPPTDTRSVACEDSNICYDILAKSFSSTIELRKFNNNFDFTKDSTQTSGVKKFPAAMHIGGVWNPADPATAKDATEVWVGSGTHYGVGYFTIYPEGSTFPWFRPM